MEILGALGCSQHPCCVGLLFILLTLETFSCSSIGEGFSVLAEVNIMPWATLAAHVEASLSPGSPGGFLEERVSGSPEASCFAHFCQVPAAAHEGPGCHSFG